MLLSRTTTCTRHSLLSLLWGTRIAAPRGVAAEPGLRAPSPLARRSRTIARPRRLPEALPGAAFPAHLGAVPYSLSGGFHGHPEDRAHGPPGPAARGRPRPRPDRARDPPPGRRHGGNHARRP